MSLATARNKSAASIPPASSDIAPGSPRRVRVKSSDEPKTTMLHVRIDDRLKADATFVLDEIGISLSEALRVFLKRVVSEKAFPFRLEVPNAATQAAIEEARRTADLPRFETADALFDDLEKGRGG